MDMQEIISNVEAILVQMGDYPDEILKSLPKNERRRLIGELDELSDCAASIQTQTDMLEFAESLFQVVERSPMLSDLLLETGSGPNGGRVLRKITFADFQANEEDDSYVQERASQIRNTVLECRDQLVKALGDEPLDVRPA